jgi:hypothetical protein
MNRKGIVSGRIKKMFRKCSRDINDRKIIGLAKTACG